MLHLSLTAKYDRTFVTHTSIDRIITHCFHVFRVNLTLIFVVRVSSYHSCCLHISLLVHNSHIFTTLDQPSLFYGSSLYQS